MFVVGGAVRRRGSSQLQSEEGLWKRNSGKGEGNVSCGLPFLYSFPSLSHLLILRLQVQRVGQEGIPNKRVSIVTGHQTGVAVLSSLVGCRPPIS